MSSAIDIHSVSKQSHSARKLVKFDEAIQLKRGGILPGMDIAFETWGNLNERCDNAILVLTGLSPSAHAASSKADPSPGWWEYMIGPDRAIDTDRYFVICMNALGSCFGSTGPASKNPKTGKAYRLDFPHLSIEDIADAASKLLGALAIDQLHTLVGVSLGGMASLSFCHRYPTKVKNHINISAAAYASSFAIAVRSLQRDIVCSDPQWNNGNYDFNQPPHNGVRLARKLGLTTYRSAEEWQLRFGRNKEDIYQEHELPFGGEFQIESYLEHNAAKFVGAFDPNCYLYLSRAMDWFDLHDENNSLDPVFDAMDTQRNLVIGVKSDILFPVWQQQEIAELLKLRNPDTEFHALDSVQGHDAFLVDKQGFTPIIRDFLNS